MPTTKRIKKVTKMKTVKFTTKPSGLDRVKADAVRDIAFFEKLINGQADLESYKLTEDEKVMLNLLIKVGTVQINAKDYLYGKSGTKKDLEVRGVWA